MAPYCNSFFTLYLSLDCFEVYFIFPDTCFPSLIPPPLQCHILFEWPFIVTLSSHSIFPWIESYFLFPDTSFLSFGLFVGSLLSTSMTWHNNKIINHRFALFSSSVQARCWNNKKIELGLKTILCFEFFLKTYHKERLCLSLSKLCKMVSLICKDIVE